jgi:hypothetical protein
MKTLIHDDDLAIYWAGKRLEISIAKPAVGWLVLDESGIIGACILNNYTCPNNIELTVVGPGAFDVRIVRQIARYCFTVARRITAITKASNARAQRGLRALGFRNEGRLREYFGEEDGLVFGLTRAEQKIVRF